MSPHSKIDTNVSLHDEIKYRAERGLNLKFNIWWSHYFLKIRKLLRACQSKEIKSFFTNYDLAFVWIALL